MPRSLATRLRERVRYGLLRQELADRLDRAGIYCHSYYVVQDFAVASPDEGDQPEPGELAQLDASQAALVAGLPCRPRPLEQVVRRMQTCACFGVLVDGELAGYSWAGFEVVPTVIGKGVLFELDDRGAYLFDTYVARAHRGRRLAQWLRARVHRALVELGRDRIYSLTSAYNSGARKFKARLGAVELEKRITYGLRPLYVRDVRLMRIAEGALSTPDKLEVRARAGERRWKS